MSEVINGGESIVPVRADGYVPVLTPTQHRLLAILNDKKRHTAEELWKCIDDEMSSRSTLRAHISHLRKQLNSVGRDVVFEHRGADSGYRLIDYVP